MHFSDKIISRTREIGSPLCLGLDPHPNLIPKLFKTKSSTLNLKSIENFLFEIIEIAKNKVAVIKIQVAFFENWGPEGMSLLVKISNFARENKLLIIMDAKRGDIGSTSNAYAQAWLGKNSYFKADAITVNPWMGIDTLIPFIETAEKTNTGIFILLKTSNAGSADLQNLKVNKKEVFLHLSDLLKKITLSHLGNLGYSRIGVVVGATKPKEAIQIRKRLPNVLFLVPGYGAQGGNAKQALSGLIVKNKKYEGGLINSSRNILFPKGAYEINNLVNWKKTIETALNLSIIDIKFKND